MNSDLVSLSYGQQQLAKKKKIPVSRIVDMSKDERIMQRFRSHVQTPSLSEPTLPELKKIKIRSVVAIIPR